MALPILAALARGASAAASAAGKAAASVGQGAVAAAQSAGSGVSSGMSWVNSTLTPVANAIGMNPVAAMPQSFTQAANVAQTAAAGVGRGAAAAVPAAQTAAATMAAPAATPAAATAARTATSPAVAAATPSPGGNAAAAANAAGATGPGPGWFSQLRQQIANAVTTAGGGGGGQGPAMPPGSPPQNPQPSSWQQFASQATTNVKNAYGSGSIVGGIKKLTDTGIPGADTTKNLIFSLAELPGKLKDFGASVVESRRNLVEYNGTFANAFAKLEFDRFGRNIRLAGMTSKSTAGLTSTHSMFEEMSLKYQAAGINVFNRMVQGVEMIAVIGTAVLENLTPIDEIAAWLAGKGVADESVLSVLSKKIASGDVFDPPRALPPAAGRGPAAGAAAAFAAGRGAKP